MRAAILDVTGLVVEDTTEVDTIEDAAEIGAIPCDDDVNIGWAYNPATQVFSIPDGSPLAESTLTPGTDPSSLLAVMRDAPANSMAYKTVYNPTDPEGDAYNTTVTLRPSGTNLGIGGAAADGIKCRLTGSIDAFGVSSAGMYVDPTIPDQAENYTAVSSAAVFGASALSALTHFSANQGTLGATSITSQYGYKVSSTLVGATNNFGFHGAIPAATGNYNLYLSGTAPAYVAGNVGIGVASPDDKLVVAGVVKPNSDNAYSLGTASRRWSTIYAATGTINTSDAREKTDILDLPPALDLICRLRPVSYRWIVGGIDVEDVVTPVDEYVDRPVRTADGQPVLDEAGNVVTEKVLETTYQLDHIEMPRAGKRVHFGLIAQEVAEVAASVGVDFAGCVYDPETDRHGLRYDQFIAPLIKAVQELTALNRSLEARVVALEAAAAP